MFITQQIRSCFFQPCGFVHISPLGWGGTSSKPETSPDTFDWKALLLNQSLIFPSSHYFSAWLTKCLFLHIVPYICDPVLIFMMNFFVYFFHLECNWMYVLIPGWRYSVIIKTIQYPSLIGLYPHHCGIFLNHSFFIQFSCTHVDVWDLENGGVIYVTAQNIITYYSLICFFFWIWWSSLICSSPVFGSSLRLF